MKKIVLSLLMLCSMQSAFAGQGDACADMYRKLHMGDSWSRESLVNYCNEKGFTSAHAEVVELFVSLRTTWDANQLFEWSKENELSAAHVDCGKKYISLGASWAAADLLLYCKKENFTKKEVSCAGQTNPQTVEALNSALATCRAQAQ